MNKDNIKAVLQFVSEGRLNAVINKYGDGVPCATKKEAIEKVADLVFNRKVEMSEGQDYRSISGVRSRSSNRWLIRSQSDQS